MNNNLMLNKRPDLIKEWDYNKNNNIDINRITIGAKSEVWWVCSKGHSWKSRPYYRIVKNCNCPYCSNRKFLKGYNDLLTKYPDIAKEWDYSKNQLNPDEISYGSNKKVYWKCSKNGKHSWIAEIRMRVRGHNCPYCNNGNKTSFGEQCIYYYLKNFGAINRYKYKGKEIDIYLPEKNIGIEYNGIYWHKNRKEKDKEKENFLSKYIKMFYICECENNKNRKYKNKIYFNYKYNDYTYLELAIKKLFTLLDIKVDINIERDKQEIYKLIAIDKKEKSFAYKFPELVKEWDYEKNLINPKEVSAYSHKKVYWKCSKGHSWEDTLLHRAYNRGCPYCSGHRVFKGFNDLLSQYPELCKEWDYSKNKIKPDEVTIGSHKKVYWKCIKGHSWQAMINNRTKSIRNTNCPYCYKKRTS